MDGDLVRLGPCSGGHTLKIDPVKLIDSRMLIQASSGAGKSWLFIVD